MATKFYNKLVRDRIPETIRADGLKPVTRILDDKEYIQALMKKLEEELKEFAEELSAAELADILEIVYALRDAIGKEPEDLEEIRRAKTVKNGAFKEKIFLERVE